MIQLLQELAKSISKSYRTFYYAHQLYLKYQELDQIPEGKNISMNKLINIYLPESSAKEKEIDEKLALSNHCPRCHYEW